MIQQWGWRETERSERRSFSRWSLSDLVKSSDWMRRKRAKPRFSVLRDLLCGGTISRLGKTRVRRGVCLGGGRDD